MRTRRGHILVADDQQHILDSLQFMLEGEGFDVTLVSDPDRIAPTLAESPVDLLLMDMNYTRDTTSGAEGLAMLAQIRQVRESLPVIVMTAWASVELGVEAMRLGASDFLEKPWNNQRLLNLIDTHLHLSQRERQVRGLNALASSIGGDDSLVFQSETMQRISELVERIAPSDANILLTGESGTGKSLIAGKIHQLSARHDKPFVQVNMGALTETLFASELFGHRKGAFTDAKSNRTGRFEMANTGTLFMDEIGNIPMALQAKLLRVLESGEFEVIGSSQSQRVDVRVLSASNIDFDAYIRAGNFRQDLFYRLNTVTIDIPPLRERIDDIAPLAQHFLDQYGRKYQRAGLGFDSGAGRALKAYPWPGNVRELAHCIERAVLISKGEEIATADLMLSRPMAGDDIGMMTLEEAEKYLIGKAMQRCDGSISAVAEVLGLSRSALYRRLDKHGIEYQKTAD